MENYQLSTTVGRDLGPRTCEGAVTVGDWGSFAPAEIDNLPKTRVILSERQRVEGSFSYRHNAAPFQCVDSSTAHLRCLLRMTQIWRHLQSIENYVIARALAPVAIRPTQVIVLL